MPQNLVQVRIRGLDTYSSDLNPSQPETLRSCKNIVINRNNVAETRRGNKIYGNEMGGSPTTDLAKVLLSYKHRILRHYSNVLEFDNGSGDFSAFNGIYSEVANGIRIKGLENQGNFYFTTSAGIKKISAATANDLNTNSGFITDAGGVKALDLNGTVDYSETGFFTQDSTVAYRQVWGIKDANQNLILGAPSSRLVLQNSLPALLSKDINNLLHSLDLAAAANTGGTLSDTDYLSTLKLDTNSDASVIFTTLQSLCTKLDADMSVSTYTTISTGHTAPPVNPVSSDLDDLQLFYDQIVDALLSESPTNITPAAQSAGNFQNSTQSAVVQLEFSVPEGITTAHFYQIYRTAVSQSTGSGVLDDLDPGDEEGLVYEANPTLAEISAGVVTLIDETPENFRGANLYTNPQSGEGILQANEVPPLARDVALFKNSVFYANTKTKQRKNINLLGISNLTSGSSKITITDGVTTNTYTFVDGIAQETDITVVAGANYVSSGAADYFDIYSTNDAIQYRPWFKSGTATAPSGTGVTLVEIDITGSETDIQVAEKVYDALNIYNDFIMDVPVTATLTLTNATKGIASDATENVADIGFIVTTTIQGEGEDITNKKILLSDKATPAQQVDETARSLIKVINRDFNEIIYAFYLSGPDDVPGLMLFEGRTLGQEAFYILANDTETGGSFSPNLSPTNFITNISVANPTEITSVGHGLTTDDEIVISGSNSTPLVDGVYSVTIIDADTFSIPVDVTVLGTTGGFKLKTLAETSDNEIAPNRIYFSKYQQSEAVPLVNNFDVGAKDSAILRILPLRDSLFVLKEDGIYRISGESAVTGFTHALFDSSTYIKADDSAVVLNNQIFMLTNQGVAVVTDTGVSIISRPIEGELIEALSFDEIQTIPFGVSYETDRCYLLGLPETNDDVVATHIFRYNTFTNTWTDWPVSKTCGLVVSEKLYFGAGDINFIEQERKNFNRTDYSDREYERTVSSVENMIISIGNISDISIGDVFFQEQYLTIYKLNQLLQKLDDDAGVSDSDYLTTLGAESGDNLRNILTDLAVKLDNDPGIDQTDFASAISGFGVTFQDTQDAYNTVVEKLNLDTSISFSNYPLSIGTVKYESIISDINNDLNTITIELSIPIILGTSIIYNHIPFEVEFNSQFFGDSELFKQVSEAKFMFEQTNFTRATVAYKSDVSTAFEEYEFEKQGNGAFGFQVFGETNFGGSGDKTPLRTLVPRNKQRCRYLTPKLSHSIAREKMTLFGYSMFFTAYSQRPYAR